MELNIILNTNSKLHLYEQIYKHIKNEIEHATLKYGDKLPSTRSLAFNLNVSRQTVCLAYDQLVCEGYIKAKKGSAYYINKYDNIYIDSLPDNIQKPVEKKERHYEYDLSPKGLDTSLFPIYIWKKLSKEILNKENVDIFASGDKKGELNLRKEIAKYLYSARGIKTNAQNIILGAGTQYLLFLLQLLLKNDRIAIEEPSYRAWSALLFEFGINVYPISINDEGIDIEMLYDSCVDLLMLTPNHHYPTGTIMSISKRKKVFEWLEKKDKRYIIEDDYDSEFRYKGSPIPTLTASCNSDKIIYMGTFSRSIASSLRISFMILPNELLDKFNKNLGFMSCTIPRIDQEILYRFIKGEYFYRHLNRMRFSYKVKHDLILNIFKKYLDKFEILGDNSGAHLLVRAKFNISEGEMVEKANKNSIKVYPISDFYVDKNLCNFKSTILLGFASISKDKLERACKILIDTWMEDI